MSNRSESSRNPLMPAHMAQEIARGLKWLAPTYAEAGAARDTTTAERDNRWCHSISQSHTPQPDHPRAQWALQ